MSQRSNQLIAVAAIALIGVAGIFITVGLLTLDNTGTTTTTTTTTTTEPTTTTTDTTTTDTTTTTTTDTTTTTTTTTIVIEEPANLTILTRYDSAIQNIFETAFLASPFAIENNIDEISWMASAPEFWDDIIDLGSADVCWGGTTEMYDQLMFDDLLSALTSSLMQEVESRVNDTVAGVDVKRNNTADQLCWIGSKLTSFGYTVNHDFFDTHSLPVPTTWGNLSEPIYGSLLPAVPTIAMANAPSSTSHKYIYDLIVQMMGWDAGWIHLSRMAGNAEIYGGSVEAQANVESGDLGIYMSLDYNGFFSHSINPDCEFIVPADGTSLYSDPIAIPVTTNNMSLAEGFIDFVLSPYGQSLWLDEDVLRLPIMREAFDEPGVTGMEDLYSVFNQTTRSVAYAVNETQSLVTTSSFIEYFESVLTDSKTELTACWSTLVELYYDGNITRSELDGNATLMADPMVLADPKTSISEKFTLDYALRINNDMLTDSSYAATVKSRWTTAAKAQYASVLGSLPTTLIYLQTSEPGLLDSLSTLMTLFIGSSGFAIVALVAQKYDEIQT